MADEPRTPILPPDALDTVEGRKLALHFLFRDVEAIKQRGVGDPAARADLARLEREINTLRQAMTEPDKTGRPGIDLPSAADLGEYGDALKKWSLRGLVVVFGLVFAWKLAAGDLVASVERLWWVFSPPDTVEEVQQGRLPADGVDVDDLSPGSRDDIREQAREEQ